MSKAQSLNSKVGGLLAALLCFSASAQDRTLQRASTAQATAGVNNTRYMTPFLTDLMIDIAIAAIGGSTNGILKLNGFGTNTFIYGLTVTNGLNSMGAGQDSVVLGPNATTTGAESTSIGNTASSESDHTVSIGSDAAIDNASFGAILIGAGTVGQTAQYGIGLGNGVTVEHTNSVAIGFGAQTTATNQIKLGNTHTVVVKTLRGHVGLATNSAGVTLDALTTAFWFTNPAAASSISNAFAVKVVSLMGPAAGLSIQGNMTFDTSDVRPTSGAGSMSLGRNTHPFVNVFSGSFTLTGTDEAYDATGWDSDLTLPTKNAVRDKIEALSLAAGTTNVVNDGNIVYLTGPTGTTNLTASSTATVLRYPDNTPGVELDNGSFQAFNEVGAVMLELSETHSVLLSPNGTTSTLELTDSSIFVSSTELTDTVRDFVMVEGTTGKLTRRRTGGLLGSLYDSSTNYFTVGSAKDFVGAGSLTNAGDFALRDGTIRTLTATNFNVEHFIATNHYTLLTNVPFLKTDANSKPEATYDGTVLTNILEKNIAVTTNTWGTAVVNFSLGTMLLTNFAGNLTLTGISGFVSSNLNWQTIDINPNGDTRTVTVPAEWWVSGAFTNATVGAITNATWARLRVEAIIGRATNASLEIFQ